MYYPKLDFASWTSRKCIHKSQEHRPKVGALHAQTWGRLWVCDQLNVSHPEGLLQSCEFDAMGFSLPAAIGASIAQTGKKIISISGDGGFVHTFGELSVAKELGLPVVAIVFVDGALGILRHQAEEMYGKEFFTRLAKIDFTKF